jgi:hypothetical protein
MTTAWHASRERVLSRRLSSLLIGDVCDFECVTVKRVERNEYVVQSRKRQWRFVGADAMNYAYDRVWWLVNRSE